MTRPDIQTQPGRASTPSAARPRILVLLAAYNGTEFLDSQLRSILNQQDVDVSVLISVDSSSDGTEELVDHWIATESRVQALPHGASAGGAAKNFFRLIAAADPAGYDAIALSDQDDVWDARKLKRAIQRLKLDGASGYSSNVRIWHPAQDTRSRLNKAQPQRRWDHLFSAAGPGSTYVMRPKAFRSYAAWQRSCTTIHNIECHDWLIYAWFRQAGLRWVIDAEATLDYRQHGSNQLGANRGLGAIRNRVRDVLNGWYSSQVMSISSAVGCADVTPVALVATGRPIDRLKLIDYASHLRRGKSERLALVALLFAESIARRGVPPLQDSAPPPTPTSPTERATR